MTQKYNIAVVGATGAVGTEIVQILEQRDFPIENLFLLASSKSKGKQIEYKDKKNEYRNNEKCFVSFVGHVSLESPVSL